MPDPKAANDRALQALESDALDKPQEVTWRSTKFTIAPANGWFLRAQHHIERGQMTQALEVMLGSEQYEQWLFGEPPPAPLDGAALANQILTAFGLDAGE